MTWPQRVNTHWTPSENSIQPSIKTWEVSYVPTLKMTYCFVSQEDKWPRVAEGVYAQLSNICFLSFSRYLHTFQSVDNTKNKLSASGRYISFASSMTVNPLKSTVTYPGEAWVVHRRDAVGDHSWMGLWSLFIFRKRMVRNQSGTMYNRKTHLFFTKCKEMWRLHCQNT